MLVQVGPDPGAVQDRIDTQLTEVISGSDARQHQELRRPEGTGAEHDLTPG